jgi:hypothetical protein
VHLLHQPMKKWFWQASGVVDIVGVQLRASRLER